MTVSSNNRTEWKNNKIKSKYYIRGSYFKQKWITGGRKLLGHLTFIIITTSTSGYTVTRPQSFISQPHDQLATTSSTNQNEDRNDYTASSIPKQNNVTNLEVKGPGLLLGDSINRGIQQHKFTRIYYLKKQTIGGETREMNQYLNQMQKRHN